MKPVVHLVLNFKTWFSQQSVTPRALPRTQLAHAHLMLGDPPWQILTFQKGKFPSPGKRPHDRTRTPLPFDAQIFSSRLRFSIIAMDDNRPEKKKKIRETIFISINFPELHKSTPPRLWSNKSFPAARGKSISSSCVTMAFDLGWQRNRCHLASSRTEEESSFVRSLFM